MTSTMSSITKPHIHINTHQNGVPAELYWPADSDPNLIVSQFPPGFFTWSDRKNCATFDAHRSTDVLNACHKDFSEVDMSYGRSIVEKESSTTIKRSAGSRPKGWQTMGPRVPMAV